MTSKIKATAINLGIFIIATATVLLFAEFFVRMSLSNTEGVGEIILSPRNQTDAQYGDFRLRRLRPDTEWWQTSRTAGAWKFSTNNKGFRNHNDFDYAKPEGTLRIMSLGDSQTQGYEVRQDYTYSAAIEGYLTKKGYDVEVINTGVAGFGTAEELLFLENEGIKYSPDVIVLGIFHNDFLDNIKSNLIQLEENGNLVTVNREYIPGVKIQNFLYKLPFVDYLGQHSYLYHQFFNEVWMYFKKQFVQKSEERASERTPPTDSKFSDYKIALLDALVNRLYEFCQQNNIKLIVLDIPQPDNERGGQWIIPTVPALLGESIAENSDAYFSSEALLADYTGVAQMHVLENRHISEFTHSILGVAAAKKIDSLFR